MLNMDRTSIPDPVLVSLLISWRNFFYDIFPFPEFQLQESFCDNFCIVVFDIELVISIIFGDYVHLFFLCVGAFEIYSVSQSHCENRQPLQEGSFTIATIMQCTAKDSAFSQTEGVSLDDTPTSGFS